MLQIKRSIWIWLFIIACAILVVALQVSVHRIHEKQEEIKRLRYSLMLAAKQVERDRKQALRQNTTEAAAAVTLRWTTPNLTPQPTPTPKPISTPPFSDKASHCVSDQELRLFSAACSRQYVKPGPDALCDASQTSRTAWIRSVPVAWQLPTAEEARTCKRPFYTSTPKRFDSVEFRCYSQNTEDGILLAVLAALGTTNKRAIEIAGGIGWENNLANLVVNFGFDALFFDGNPRNTRCATNFLQQHEGSRDRWQRGVWWSSEPVTVENVNSIIQTTTGWHGDIDVFSLDIDGIDLWIWNALTVVTPRIVVVEIQELWGPDDVKTRPYKPDHKSQEIAAMGASISAFVRLAAKRNYRLVGCIRNGFNAFFVRNDVHGVDTVFGSSTYATSGCFAHVDAAWQEVLNDRRQRAAKYEWVGFE